jgi:hypothetical protein
MNRPRAHFPVNASVTDRSGNVWHFALDASARAGSSKIGRPCWFDEGLHSASAHLIAPEGFMPRP